MALRALTGFLVAGLEVHPGEVVPESFVFNGRERIDPDALVAAGMVERVEAEKPRRSRKPKPDEE